MSCRCHAALSNPSVWRRAGTIWKQYGTLMAGTLLCSLPVILLFLLLQRECVAGLTAGAVKG